MKKNLILLDYMIRSLQLLTSFLLLLTLPLWSQEPVSIHLTGNDELPDVEFYTLVEDKEGNIWFGADKGLFKYDGKEYKSYSHPKKRGRSFFSLKFDERGRLWCNNIAGQFFYVENDALVLFCDYQEELKGALYEFTFLNNHLYISAGDQYIIVDIDTKQKEVVKKSDGHVNAVVIDNKAYLFDGFLNYTIFNKDRLPLQKVNPVDFNRFLGEGRYNSKTFIIDSYFILNIYSLKDNENFYYKIDGTNIQPLQFPESLKSRRIEKIRNHEGTFYLSTEKGIVTGTIENSVFKISETFLEDQFITGSIHDAESNLWCTTINNGIFIIPSETLKVYDQVKSQVTRLERKNDSICFLGGENGFLATLNIKTGKIDKIENNRKFKVSALNYNTEKDRLIVNDIKASQVFESGKLRSIALGAAAKNIKQIDDSRYLASFYVFSQIYNFKKGTDTIFNNSRSYKSHYSVKDKKIYLCNVNGVLVYDDNFNKINNILFKNSPIYALDITETDDGTIWVATYDKGVIGIKDDVVVEQISEIKGLSSNTPNGIKADGNHLWIATDSGMQYYNTTDGTFKSISKRDGINSFNINDIEILGNTVLLANNDGLYSFDKRTIFKDRNVPQPYFTGVAIKEKDTLIQPEYTLAQEESDIRFNFNTRGFKSTDYTQYQYQLLGFDDQWINIEQGIHTVKFNTLPAGDYTFNLKAKNKFENNYSVPISTKILVTLPFYKTWWFLAIVFAIIALLLYTYFNFEKRRLKTRQKIALEKSELSKELVFSQLENLRSQMNPHFIFNALNSIQDYIILNEGKMARAYLVKFSSLMRKYLDHSQKNEVTLAEEIEALNLYLELEKDRFEGNFSYKVLIDPTLDLKYTTVPSLLIQPYVENALKHGLMHKKEDKSLLLKFEKNKDPLQLICTIEDNGIGREASLVINKNRYKNHKSFASKANQKRIDLLNQARDTKLELTIEDLYNGTKPAGTRVTLKMPIFED